MKKAIIVYAFIILLKPVLPVFEYVINYDYIVTELCENKEKPVMRCNGKCHLMKELAKASENEKPITGKKPVMETEVMFFQPLADIPFAFSPVIPFAANNVAYRNFYNHVAIQAIFHPPAVIS